MTITLNGKKEHFSDILSLDNLVKEHGLNPEHVVAEINGEIIDKSLWNTTNIKNGDSLELLKFVGGGQPY